MVVNSIETPLIQLDPFERCQIPSKRGKPEGIITGVKYFDVLWYALPTMWRLTTDDNLRFNSFLPGRLTWRLTNCTSQSKTRKLSESSPWSSTCSLSGILLTYRSHILVAFLVCHQPLHPSSLGAILLSLYYVFLWKNPHTQAALQKAKVIASKN